MKLLGTTTSPYTRKIRVVLNAMGRPYEFLDIRTEPGASALKAAAPLGKIPVLLADDGATVPDSSLIVSWLWAKDAPALRTAGWNLDPNAFADRALQTVVEGALDAAINHRYLRLDGFVETGYIAKQRERVERVLSWLDARMAFERPLGNAGLSLGCTLDWIVFRDVIELARWPALTAFRQSWKASGVGNGTEPHD
ncbi:MAG TPA: glutathione S-transferase N-terminal domain-containing protein [Polyangia bacterium]|jgi:glutathione S-transferase